jgi:LysR family pca operon transcriptional activator
MFVKIEPKDSAMPARDYRLLAYFVEIVDAGSLREAARRLSLSPPVVSAALADLEALARTTLLRRGRRGAVPTREGAALYETASAMVTAARAAMVPPPSANTSGRLAASSRQAS